MDKTYDYCHNPLSYKSATVNLVLFKPKGA
jgi:hypothetical protein